MPELLDRLFGRNDRVRGYATALVAVADAEGVLDRVADELFAFSKAVEQDAKLRDALTDRALPLENRRALIQDILGGRGGSLGRPAERRATHAAGGGAVARDRPDDRGEGRRRSQHRRRRDRTR